MPRVGRASGEQDVQDLLRIRERPGATFRPDRLAVHLDLEATPVGGNQFETGDAALQFVEQEGRQTDGFRLVVSDRAVLDADVHGSAPTAVERAERAPDLVLVESGGDGVLGRVAIEGRGEDALQRVQEDQHDGAAEHAGDASEHGVE